MLRRKGDDYVAFLMNPTNYPKVVNGKLTFIAEETPMIQEIRERLANRAVNENSYILISSKQKQKSIDLMKMMHSSVSR